MDGRMAPPCAKRRTGTERPNGCRTLAADVPDVTERAGEADEVTRRADVARLRVDELALAVGVRRAFTPLKRRAETMRAGGAVARLTGAVGTRDRDRTDCAGARAGEALLLTTRRVGITRRATEGDCRVERGARRVLRRAMELRVRLLDAERFERLRLVARDRPCCVIERRGAADRLRLKLDRFELERDNDRELRTDDRPDEREDDRPTERELRLEDRVARPADRELRPDDRLDTPRLEREADLRCACALSAQAWARQRRAPVRTTINSDLLRFMATTPGSPGSGPRYRSTGEIVSLR